VEKGDITITIDKYDEDYFEHGISKGISGYERYRWMPEKTFPMVDAYIRLLGIRRTKDILDFGCAKGFVVKAFNLLGYHCWGCDISEYAITHAEPEAKDLLTLIQPGKILTDLYDVAVPFDFIIAKTVFEHMYPAEIRETLEQLALLSNDLTKLLVIVPIAIQNGGKYILSCDEADITHLIRATLSGWVKLLESGFWELVEARTNYDCINDEKAELEV